MSTICRTSIYIDAAPYAATKYPEGTSEDCGLHSYVALDMDHLAQLVFKRKQDVKTLRDTLNTLLET